MASNRCLSSAGRGQNPGSANDPRSLCGAVGATAMCQESRCCGEHTRVTRNITTRISETMTRLHTGLRMIGRHADQSVRFFSSALRQRHPRDSAARGNLKHGTTRPRSTQSRPSFDHRRQPTTTSHSFLRPWPMRKAPGPVEMD